MLVRRQRIGALCVGLRRGARAAIELSNKFVSIPKLVVHNSRNVETETYSTNYGSPLPLLGRWVPPRHHKGLIRLWGQQLVARLFIFIFPKTMLKLTDAELESNAERPRKACPPDFRDDFIAELRSFRREIRDELTSCESVKDLLARLLS